MSAKGGLSHPRISTAHVSGSHALRRSTIPHNWRKCWKFRSGMKISVSCKLISIDIFMALKPFDSRVLQEYLVSWHMNDRWENAWIVLTQLFLNLLVPASFSACVTCQISVRRRSVILTDINIFLPTPLPHFLQTCGMAASLIISFSNTMGYRYYDSSLHYTRSFWCSV